MFIAEFFILILQSLIVRNECTRLDWYQFTVYTTESCPKNKMEWLGRASALNCNNTNGYMCIPNEDITMLLEFCYNEEKIIVPKDKCLILSNHSSSVDDYRCHKFSSGCPNYSYFSDEIFKHQSCISVGQGCFLAEPDCNWINVTSRYSTEESIKPNSNKTEDRIYMFWILGGLTVFVWLLAISSFICVSYRSITNKSTEATNKSRYRVKKEVKSPKENEPLIK